MITSHSVAVISVHLSHTEYIQYSTDKQKTKLQTYLANEYTDYYLLEHFHIIDIQITFFVVIIVMSHVEASNINPTKAQSQ